MTKQEENWATDLFGPIWCSVAFWECKWYEWRFIRFADNRIWKWNGKNNVIPFFQLTPRDFDKFAWDLHYRRIVGNRNFKHWFRPPEFDCITKAIYYD